MFLRWMIRKSSPDLGIWNVFSQSELFIPMDTHMFSVCEASGYDESKASELENCRGSDKEN